MIDPLDVAACLAAHPHDDDPAAIALLLGVGRAEVDALLTRMRDDGLVVAHAAHHQLTFRGYRAIRATAGRAA